MDQQQKKYQVGEPQRLSSWKKHAYREIKRWIEDDEYRDKVTAETLSKDDNPPGPFTKFLYHFGFMCECGWGVMIDFNERSQRIFLTDHYYKWMHKLRDEIYLQKEIAQNPENEDK